jgi:uncharacterized membrane protein
MVFALLPLVFAAVVGLAYAWFVTVLDVRAAGTLDWPRTIAVASLLASTALVPLPLVMVLFFIDPHDQKGIAWSMAIAVLLFVLSLPGAFVRKGPLRWGLVLSSIFFLGFVGFVYLVSGWQF